MERHFQSLTFVKEAISSETLVFNSKNRREGFFVSCNFYIALHMCHDAFCSLTRDMFLQLTGTNQSVYEFSLAALE